MTDKSNRNDRNGRDDELARLRAEVKALKERAAIAEAERAELRVRAARGEAEHAELLGRIDSLLSRVSLLISSGGLDSHDMPPRGRRRHLRVIPPAAIVAFFLTRWHRLAPLAQAGVAATTAVAVGVGSALILAPPSSRTEASRPRLALPRPSLAAPVAPRPRHSPEVPPRQVARKKLPGIVRQGEAELPDGPYATFSPVPAVGLSQTVAPGPVSSPSGPASPTPVPTSPTPSPTPTSPSPTPAPTETPLACIVLLGLTLCVLVKITTRRVRARLAYM